MGFCDQYSNYLRGAVAALRVEVIATMVEVEGLGVEEGKAVNY